MKYYANIKSIEVLLYATTWLNLESIMLSDGNRICKATYDVAPFMLSTMGQSIEAERLVIARGREEGIGTDCWQVQGFFGGEAGGG